MVYACDVLLCDGTCDMNFVSTTDVHWFTAIDAMLRSDLDPLAGQGRIKLPPRAEKIRSMSTAALRIRELSGSSENESQLMAGTEI